jgi:TolB-like protein
MSRFPYNTLRKISMKRRIVVLFTIFLFIATSFAGGEWFKIYKNGVKALQSSNYNEAIVLFQQALKVKQRDTKKIRTYGMHFIEYYTHRELGIAYYYLGDMQKADQHLRISMQYEPSNRAQEYLSKISSGSSAPQRRNTPPPTTQRQTPPPSQQNNTNNYVPAAGGAAAVGVIASAPLKRKKSDVNLVGERMSIAIFPFETMGSAGGDLGNIVFDKMITALFNQERFKVIERNQLERILDEQKLGMTGIIDASTAAQLGKGIGADAIILGSVSLTRSGALSVDARAIDTESATIITAQDAYAGRYDQRILKQLVDQLAIKFVQSFPLVEGFVIKNDGSVMIDKGTNNGLKKGMKCVVYREGAEIKHPVTGEVLGKDIKVVSEITIKDVYKKYASGRILSDGNGDIIQVGDKFVTK